MTTIDRFGSRCIRSVAGTRCSLAGMHVSSNHGDGGFIGLTETSLTVRSCYVHVVLLAVGVDTESFKVDVSARSKLRLNRAGDVNRGFQA